jgi:hypothetical protein
MSREILDAVVDIFVKPVLPLVVRELANLWLRMRREKATPQDKSHPEKDPTAE